MITARNVTKVFGRTRAVDDISFELPVGSALALWGSNGAGKTTLIRCLLGVIRFRGGATIAGIDVVRRGREARSNAGYVPQELAFHDDARLDSSMLFFAGLRRVDKRAAMTALDTVGLAGHERKRVRDLSGGMKQRLALAIALLSDPSIIVLDEPTSNLDADGRGEVAETLARLKDSGKTLLFASHRPDEVIALADRILVMESGKGIRDTTPSELWPSESRVQVVRLHLTLASEKDAAKILRDTGHAVHLNGHGLCVAVARDQKTAPVYELAKMGIEVRDMELLEGLEPQEAKG
jgi:ABC-type multidrug transport system ATPase subunit